MSSSTRPPWPRRVLAPSRPCQVLDAQPYHRRALVAGGPVAAQLQVGTQTTFMLAAPDGTFFVRVLAMVNGAAVSSSEIRVDIVPPALPAAPQNLTAAVVGSVINFVFGSRRVAAPSRVTCWRPGRHPDLRIWQRCLWVS